jgi:hypothetical protein
MRRSGWLCPGAEAALPHEATALRAVSHRLETETALAPLHCRIFGRKIGFHFP